MGGTGFQPGSRQPAGCAAAGRGRGGRSASAVDRLLDQGHVGRVLDEHPLVGIEQVERRDGPQVVESRVADHASRVAGIDPRRRDLAGVGPPGVELLVCLLYTSDAAEE